MKEKKNKNPIFYNKLKVIKQTWLVAAMIPDPIRLVIFAINSLQNSLGINYNYIYQKPPYVLCSLFLRAIRFKLNKSMQKVEENKERKKQLTSDNQ